MALKRISYKMRWEETRRDMCGNTTQYVWKHNAIFIILRGNSRQIVR